MKRGKVIDILREIKDIINKNKLFLSELDGAIGDGDHGINMSKGFNAVYEKIKYNEKEDIGDILKEVAMILISNVGGASGPLYGTAFLKASMVVKGKTEVNAKDFLDMLNAGIEGIKFRGKSTVGEKTMLDSLVPAYEAGVKALYDKKTSKELLGDMKIASFKGVENTRNLIATKGRASYLGKRSLGHEDPGATSSALIIEAIYNSL